MARPWFHPQAGVRWLGIGCPAHAYGMAAPHMRVACPALQRGDTLGAAGHRWATRLRVWFWPCH
jgi:hypothetical protein